jgi:hypothetical protein
MDMPALAPRTVSIDPMDPAHVIDGNLTVGEPLHTEDFEIFEAGMHRFVLTELEQDGARVQFQVVFKEPGGGYTPLTTLIPLGYREGHGLDLEEVGEYIVHVWLLSGVPGEFELSILRQKPMTTISSTADPYVINIINVDDFMQFERQQNDYLFRTPESTGTGLPTPTGIYRFDIMSVPSEVSVRSTIQLEVFLERGMVRVVGPIDLALFEGINGELRDDETYIIRTTQIPIAGSSSGTVMSDDIPYRLRVSAQKDIAPIRPMATNVANRISRISVVNDSFQFVGQMNTYIFVAPSSGTFEFRPNLMPGPSEFLISDPWGNVAEGTIGVGGGISKNLVSGVTYRMHITHQPAASIGAYSFTIVYP